MKIEDVEVRMKVRFHPIIGLKHDGNVWTVTSKGTLPSGQEVVWLKGKAGCVAVEAISALPEPAVKVLARHD